VYFERTILNELFEHLSSRQITVLTGMRRTGKTTILKELLKRINSKNKFYIDLERLDNRELFNEKNYDNIINSLKQNGLKVDEKIFLFIDEIQISSNIPSVIKYLYDNYNIKFVLTGSSSYYLKNMFTESLSGRKKIFELKTLNFYEFLKFKEIVVEKFPFPFHKFNAYEYERLNRFYYEFVEYGGFPEVVLTDSINEKTDLLNDIITSYIYIDLKSLSDIKNIENLNKLLKLLAVRIGSKLIISKISSLTGISRETVKNYLQFLEDTFIVKRINTFTKNPNREISKAQKLYFTDNGIMKILGAVNSGSLFENAICNQLLNYGTPKYYARKDGKEIDFILNDFAFEAKESPDLYDYKKLKRLSEKIGFSNIALIGKNRMDNFSDYIWGGSIS